MAADLQHEPHCFRGQVTTIVFHADGGSAELFIDHQTKLEIVGGALSAGGPVLARYMDGAWSIGSQRLTHITCEGLVELLIQTSVTRRSFGPLRELSLVGELALSLGDPLARYYPRDNMWHADLGDRLPAALGMDKVTHELLSLAA